MSEKQSFILRNLDLRKLPGLPRGLKEFQDFSPYINIIYGPNASGKSSTVRAIQQLIWQQERKGVELEASASINEDAWVFHIDHQPVLTQKNGVNTPFHGVPAVEIKSHYALSIDDLFVDDHAGLAGEIRKQAIGGYDLDEAKKRLEFSGNIYTTAIKEYKEYEASRKKVLEIQNEQEQYKVQEQTLEDLRGKEQSARAAKSKVNFLEKQLAYLEKFREVSQYENELSQYGKIYTLLRGDEMERIDELEREIQMFQDQLKTIERKIVEEEEKQAGLEIPDEGISVEILDELDRRLDALQSVEQKIDDLEAEISGLEETMRVRLSEIDPGIDPDLWNGMNIRATLQLDEILSDAHRLLAKQYIIKTQLQQVSSEDQETVEHVGSLETLSRSLHALSEWLKVESVDRRYSTITVVVLGVVSIASGMTWILMQGKENLTTMAWLVASALIVVSVAVVVIYIYINKKRKNNRLKIWQDDFEATQVPKPAEWTPEAVAIRIREIISEIEIEEKRLRNEEEKQKLQTVFEKNERGVEDLHSRMSEFKEVYQTVPDLPDFVDENYSTFYWFVRNVANWQDAHAKYQSASEMIRRYKKQYDDELDQINAIFQNKCKAEPVEDFAAAAARDNRLRKEVGARNQILTNLKHESENRSKTNRQLKVLQEKLAGIYRVLDLPAEDKWRLRNFLDNLEGYKNTRKKWEDAKSALNERYLQVKNHSLYPSDQPEMDSLHIDQLENEIEELKRVAQKHENILEEITRRETEIDRKKRDDKLEKALNEKDEAFTALEEKFLENLHSNAGDLIIRQLQERTQKHNQPQVVKRANALLGKITRYRYELLSGHGGDGTFWVQDLETNVGLELGQLSAGTRVQLLLAIKIAYLELQESNVKLPLLADELLANSDDLRTPAIIEALTELSKDGRQIFYFTAQWDERRSWENHLTREGVNYRTYDIGEAGEKTGRLPVSEVPDVSFFEPGIPAPDGLNYEEYGKLLDLDFHLVEDDQGQLPLYFLAGKTNDLYALLQRNICNWRQLEYYLHHGGVVDWITSDELEKMREKMILLERYQALYKIGRPRRIGRSEIEDSGAVSEVFMERVLKLLSEVEGDPVRLIEGLKARGVVGFYSNKTEELEEYLMAQGFLDDSPRLSEEEIRIALQAQMSQMKAINAEEAEIFLSRILEYQRQDMEESV